MGQYSVSFLIVVNYPIIIINILYVVKQYIKLIDSLKFNLESEFTVIAKKKFIRNYILYLLVFLIASMPILLTDFMSYFREYLNSLILVPINKSLFYFGD